MALGMIKSLLLERQTQPEILELIFPMNKDELNIKKLWIKNVAQIVEKARTGKNLVFITLGDPMLYSTFLYLYQIIRETHPELPLEIIPGVTSVTAAAASAKIPLSLKDEVVSIMPSDLNIELIEDTAKHSDNLVFMKCAYRIKDAIPALERAGFNSESTVALVKRCTLPEEQVRVGKLEDVKKWDIQEDYFSVAIVKRTKAIIEWKKDA